MLYNTTQRKIDQIQFYKKEAKERKKLYKAYTKQETRYFAADFECTTTEPYKVYLVTMKEIGVGEPIVFYNIEDFLDYFADMKKAVVWFHNGENYDFEFIRPAAYKYYISVYNEKGFMLRYDQPLMEVDLRNGDMKLDDKHHEYIPVQNKIIFLDSTAVVKSSIKAIGEMLGKEKGMGEVETPLVHYINSDTDWEYHTGQEFTPSYKEYKMTTSFKRTLVDKRWTEYAIRDTEILEALVIAFELKEHYDKHNKTIAKIAFDELCSHAGYGQFRYEFARAVKAKEAGISKEEVGKLQAEAKKAYKGGIAWTNPIHANKLRKTKHGYHLDYTSMYPSIYGNAEKYPLPYFLPVGYKTDLYIVHYKNIKATVKPGCFPLLKTRTDVKSPNSNAYIPKFEGPISLTSVEDKYLHECYDIEYVDKDSPIDYYDRHDVLENALRVHLEKWYHVKETETGTMKTYAKLMLNAVYGYLGFFKKPTKLYSYKYDRANNRIIKELRDKEAYIGMAYPEVPAACFITAYGRVKLARDINAIGIEHVVCCDTDSLFIIDLDYETIKSRVAISDKLGDFKLEHKFNQIRSIKAKTYAIADDDGVITAQATAGSNYKFKNIENFVEGQEYLSLEHTRGPGGVGLFYQTKVLGGKDKELID